MQSFPSPLRVGLVAGEQSGDALGAELIRALRAHIPDARFFGIAGPQMAAAGCEQWAPASSLSVMGLMQVVPHLRRLLKLRADTTAKLIAAAPDVFVGIDAKEFNLSLAPKLRAAGLLTVQYVSPQIWAWRPGRIKRMHRAVDLVLCLLPFEKPFYDARNLRAEFVGHPLADALPLEPDRGAARERLGLPPDAEIVALLPGSRAGEVALLGADFARVVSRLRALRPALVFVAALANPEVKLRFEEALRASAAEIPVARFEGRAQEVLAASDVALVASGTATLEAALCKRPMVVIYRLDTVSAWIIRRFRLVKSEFFAQPNLLAGRRVVGEYFQNDIDAVKIAAELLAWLDDAPKRRSLAEIFMQIHLSLRRNASERAAQAVLDLVRTRRRRG